MLELMSLTPLLLVAIGTLVARYFIRRKPFTLLGWVCSAVGVLGAILLPLTQGVWIPDFTGNSRTLGQTTSTKGDRFEVVQYWNHVDFYTTEVQITKSDGSVSVVVIDGDASRSQDATIDLDEAGRMAMVEVDGSGYPAFEW